MFAGDKNLSTENEDIAGLEDVADFLTSIDKNNA